MTRYAALFEGLRHGVFVPFCMLSDPAPEETESIVAALVDGGADALELGIPFSDPIADGPVIQAAAFRALASGARVADAWRLIERIRSRFDVPICLLTYANLVEARGHDTFYGRAAAAGVDAVLLADVPTDEVRPFAAAAYRHGIDPALMASPGASSDELATIAELCRGFTYVVTRRGVAGSDEDAGRDYIRTLAALRICGAPPAILGYGIARPEQARAAWDAGAAGVVAGSAVVKIVAAHLDDPQARDIQLRAYAAAMKEAMRDPRSGTGQSG